MRITECPGSCLFFVVVLPGVTLPALGGAPLRRLRLQIFAMLCSACVFSCSGMLFNTSGKLVCI